MHVIVEMVTRSWKNTRYEHLVCPVGLYNSLKDLPSCSEWIDVCYKWLFENMQWYTGADPGFSEGGVRIRSGYRGWR